MMVIDRGVYLACFWRTYLVGSAYNTRGMQSVGFINAIDAGLAHIHSPENLAAARARYAARFNCHPYWTPLLLGMYLNAEQKIANGLLETSHYLTVKDTAANTLSALGDSLFGGTLLVSWSLLASILVVHENYVGCAALTIALFAGIQLVRFGGFMVGLHYGFRVLTFLRRINLINWAFRFKTVNALLLYCFLAAVFPPEQHPWQWMLLVVSLVGASAVAMRMPRVRVPAAILMFTAMLALWRVYYGT